MRDVACRPDVAARRADAASGDDERGLIAKRSAQAPARRRLSRRHRLCNV